MTVGVEISPVSGVARIETERFYLRTLTSSDASALWLAWLSDPEVMHPMNAPTRQVSLPELQAHIARHDPARKLLIGIFDQSNDLHIGYYRIALEKKHLLATFSHIVGDKNYWGLKVVNETRAALLDYVFRERSVEKAIGMPPARNFPSVFNYHEQRWRLEGILKSHRRSLISSGRIDQLLFGLTKEEWMHRRGAK